MPLDSIELVLSTIAVIFKPPLLQGDISAEQVGAILKRPITVASGPNLTTFSSMRDQIDVLLLPNKLDVRELSGDVKLAKSALPRILVEFMGILSNPAITSYGINFIVEVKLEDPRRWLGSSFVSPSMIETLGQPIQLPMLSLQLDHPPKAWLVRFEVLPNNVLTVNFNASESPDVLPSEDVLATNVKEQYAAFIGFLRQIGIGA